MNTHDKYALPPLPEPLCNLPTYCQDAIKQYTRSVLDDHLNEQDAVIEGVEEEILICTLDGHRYFLGPEYDGELEWENAKHWCESLGEGYELPNRLVMLAICMNEETAALLTKDSYYWTSSVFKDDPSFAWYQDFWGFSSPCPGFQSYSGKCRALRVRAVRRRRVEGEGE